MRNAIALLGQHNPDGLRLHHRRHLRHPCHGQLGSADADHGGGLGGALRLHLDHHPGHQLHVLHPLADPAGHSGYSALCGAADDDCVQGVRKDSRAGQYAQRHDHRAAALPQTPLEAHSEGGFSEGMGYLQTGASDGDADFPAVLGLLLQRQRQRSGQPAI